MALTFPSPAFPALPSVTIRPPRDWKAIPVSGAVLAASAPEQEGTFTANVVVTIFRHAGELRLEDAGSILRGELASLPEFAEIGMATVGASARPTFVCEASFLHPEAGPLIQSHRVWIVASGPFSDQVHAVATCSSEEMDRLPALRKLVDTIAPR